MGPSGLDPNLIAEFYRKVLTGCMWFFSGVAWTVFVVYIVFVLQQWLLLRNGGSARKNLD